MTNAQAIKWFREAKFGMFIHWGIYSLLEDGEWVMYGRQIPVKEYEKLAAKFNPTEFNADEWVATAKAAGMRYIVITAKHHDGFSMFKTAVSKFNIVDATPFARDPMKELCQACKREGLKLGFYYSHVREWRHPLAQSFEMQGRPDRLGNYGNFWDYPDENGKDLQRYIDEFDIPQLRELLTQYGDILTIWFDTPSLIKHSQGEQIRDFVHSVQPGCLVNGRLSNEIEVDYKTMGDCEVPASGADMAWDTPMTSSGSWGYKAHDTYRPAGEFIRELSDIASKGGNYLLNVGPTPQGVIPEASRRELAKVGQWLSVNGEAIYDCAPAGLSYRPTWGCVTKRGNILYLIVFDEAARDLRLTGLLSAAKTCALLGGGKLNFTQTHSAGANELKIGLGENAIGGVRVVAVECEEDVQIEKRLMPGDDDSIELDCVSAKLHADYKYSKLCLENGATRRWFNAQDWLEWHFISTEASATYAAELVLEGGGFWKLEDFGHAVEVFIDGEKFALELTRETISDRRDGRRYAAIGRVALSAGEHTLSVKPARINKENMVGLTLYGARLMRA